MRTFAGICVEGQHAMKMRGLTAEKREESACAQLDRRCSVGLLCANWIIESLSAKVPLPKANLNCINLRGALNKIQVKQEIIKRIVNCRLRSALPFCFHSFTPTKLYKITQSEAGIRRKKGHRP